MREEAEHFWPCDDDRQRPPPSERCELFQHRQSHYLLTESSCIYHLVIEGPPHGVHHGRIDIRRLVHKVEVLTTCSPV
jgi:hypothetical protein